MNVVVALLFGLGVFLIYDGWTRPTRSAPRLSQRARIEDWLAAGGLGHVRASQFLASCMGLGLAAAALALVVVGSAAVTLIAAAAGVIAPVSYYRSRRHTLRRRRRSDWPDAIELLTGAVRSGDTLPAAVAVVAERGPESLRPVFRSVVSDHRITGDLVGALERMGGTVGDPVADRVVRTLILAHQVGGRDLGRVLRTLAVFLREDVANRREVEARQSWTVVAARVSAAAPWLVLVLVASRPQGARAFDTPAGMVVLLIGAAVTAIGYRLMLRVGRLPEEPRVLIGAGE